MKLNEKNTKLIVLGLPRSGTTIVTNYLYSQPDIFLFSEPHWQYKRFRSNAFFKDEKLEKINCGRYNFLSRTPLLKSLHKIGKYYKCVGFKETYRGPAYKHYKRKLCNDDLIETYKKKGFRILYVLRNPVDIWNSMMKFNDSGGAEWGKDIEAFIQNCDELFSAAQCGSFIDYEAFVQNPAQALEKSGIDKSLLQTDVLREREFAIGDSLANASKKIKKQNGKKNISLDDEMVIKKSTAYQIYNKLKSKKCET